VCRLEPSRRNLKNLALGVGVEDSAPASGEEYVLRDSQVRPGGILTGSVDGLILGDALRLGRALCLRLVFAIQLDI